MSEESPRGPVERIVGRQHDDAAAWLRKTASQMRGQACVEFGRHKRMLNAFATDIETAAMIADESCKDAAVSIAALRDALLRLWSWTSAEAEHFDGAMPDDDIVAAVKNALTPNAALSGPADKA